VVTYVLGAGASCHAGYPLTSELGDRLHAWARQTGFTWGGLIDELNELYGGLTDLEKILTELNHRPEGSRAVTLSQTHCGSIIGALNVAIPELFYNLCQNPLQGRDLYQELARCKLGNDDTIITFNYDMACERALKVEGKWEIGDGYGFSLGVGITPPSKTKLLKLHGSTNWLGILFDGHKGYSTATNVYGPRPCLFGERYFTYLGYPKDVRDPQCRHVSNPGGDPALILPALQKNFFNQTTFGNEWEPFWDDIWGQAAHALHSSDKIVIIGYSMPKADERARGLLLHANRQAEILVFSGSNTHGICEEFRSHDFTNVSSSLGRRHVEDYLNG
jgi:hypothetical protein